MGPNKDMMNMYRRSCHSNSATDSDTACHAFERNTNSVRSTAATKEHVWASRLAFKKTNNKKWRPAFNLLVSHNWTSRVWESDNLPIVTHRMDTDNYPWAANICLHIETHMFHILWIPAACTKYVVLFFASWFTWEWHADNKSECTLRARQKSVTTNMAKLDVGT